MPNDPAERSPAARDRPLQEPSASHQPISAAATLNLDRPQTIKVKVEPSSPPLPHSPSSPSMDLNLERPRVRPLPSRTNPAEVIDLTRSPTAPGELILDRPHHKAGSGPSVTTPPASINLERPLHKAKSSQSYAGLPPFDRPSFTAEGGTNSTVNQELTVQEWADDKLAFPRTKVGDASIV